MQDEHTRIDPAGPAARWRPSRLQFALGTAGGFFVGVLLVIVLGGTPSDTKTKTETQVDRVTVTNPTKVLPGGTTYTVTAVPQLVGERLDTAKDRLSEAQFDVDVSGGGLFGIVVDENWEVVDQDPPAGTQLRQGSTVHISVEKR